MWISLLTYFPMDTQTLWQTILTDLEIQVTRAIFKTFISQMSLLSFDGQTATISCNQPILIPHIEQRFYQIIKKTFDTYTKTDTKLVFTGKREEKRKNFDGPLFTMQIKEETSASPNIRLSPNCTFANFAVSSSNQMAYAAATAVAKTPGTSYNPLFLYGGVGVGKTHLMQGVGHKIIKDKPATRVIYCTGEEFTNEIIEAIGNKTTASFKKKYRRVNVLLIDDIQFIAGKNAVQEEFFHTFNSIHQMGGQIVLTSDKPPEEINKLENRLKSRFEGGLTIDIGPPDFELRTAILLIKAKQKGIELGMEIAKIIASSIENPRKLEGVLIRVMTEAQTNGLPLDIELTKRILGKTIKEAPQNSKVKPNDIIDAVASFYNLKLSQLKGNKRDRSVSLPRQILYFLLRSESNIQLMEIGNLLGGRDHTTILHGVRKISEMISTNETIREDILGIRNKIAG